MSKAYEPDTARAASCAEAGPNTMTLWVHSRMTPYEKAKAKLPKKRQRPVALARDLVTAHEGIKEVMVRNVLDKEMREVEELRKRQRKAAEARASYVDGDGTKLSDYFMTRSYEPLKKLSGDDLCQDCIQMHRHKRKRSQTYKRENHLKERLTQIQGAQRNPVPLDVKEAVEAEISKYRIENPTDGQIRAILKRLGLHTYYEHVQSIRSEITGEAGPVINWAMTEKIIERFKEVQEAFERHKPPHRQNLISYNFILYKLCELMELDHMLAHLPLLKSRQKLQEADALWMCGCGDVCVTHNLLQR
jgi:hypothetical protein